jgi:predicted DNA-binding protein
MDNRKRKPENEGKKHNVPIYFPDDLFQRGKAVGDKLDRPFSFVVRMALKKYLEAWEKKNAEPKP